MKGPLYLHFQPLPPFTKPQSPLLRIRPKIQILAPPMAIPSGQGPTTRHIPAATFQLSYSPLRGLSGPPSLPPSCSLFVGVGAVNSCFKLICLQILKGKYGVKNILLLTAMPELSSCHPTYFSLNKL